MSTSALKRIDGLTLAHLTAINISANREVSQERYRLLKEVADAIAPYIARAQMDTEAKSGEAA